MKQQSLADRHDLKKSVFGCNEDLLNAALSVANIKEFHKGNYLTTEGDKDDNIFVLLSGGARVIQINTDGSEVLLNQLPIGVLFGEMSALIGSPRTATVVCNKNSRVAVFSCAHFIQLMTEHGALGLEVSKLLAQRVAHTSMRAVELNTLPVKDRVYNQLERLSTTVKGQQIVLPETAPKVVELARTVHSTRETVSRALKELEQTGYITRHTDGTIILESDIESA